MEGLRLRVRGDSPRARLRCVPRCSESQNHVAQPLLCSRHLLRFPARQRPLTSLFRDRRIQSAEVAVLRKKIKKFNVVTGVLLAVLTGASPFFLLLGCGPSPARVSRSVCVAPSDRLGSLLALLISLSGGFGAVTTLVTLDTLTSPFAVLSTLCICVYTGFFGILILMFELSNSPKVNKYFRENYGFFMNFNGRAIFLFSVGFFATGAGSTGVLSGFLAILDGMFHLYVVRRNPQMKIAIKESDAARMAGTSQGDDSGIFTKVANMAVEDPNKLKNTAKMGANMASSNPSQGGMMMAAAGVAAQSSMPPAPAPAPAPMYAPAPAPAPMYAPAPAPAAAPAAAYGQQAGFVVDDYELGDDDGTAI